MKKPARYFVLLSLGLAAALCGGLAGFNFWVDPYNRFGNNRLGVFISAERESKATEVRRYPHHAWLLGNSRMAMIPAAPLAHFQFFNAAFGGGTAEEAYYFAQHFATNLEVVVLGIDWGQCDPPLPQGDIFAPPTWEATLGNVLNLKTTEYSIRTIADHLAGKPPSLRNDGSFEATGWFKLYDAANPAARDWQLQQLKDVADRFTKPTAERLSFYTKLAEILQQRGISCVVVIPPLHPALAQHVREADHAPAFAEWRRLLGAIFPTVVDLSQSSYSAAENFFQADPVHFKPDVGVRLLNQEVIPVAVRLRAASIRPRPNPQ